jgi:anti-sigma-K factor RskA
MTNNDIHHLAAAYALDALDPAERAEFEAHYPSCDVCRTDVFGFRATLTEVAAANPVAPSADVKARVMQQVAQTRQLSPLLPEGVVDLAQRRRRASFSTLAAAAAAVVLLVGAASFFVGRTTSGGEQFAADVEQILERPDGRVVTLDGPGSGQFKIVWSDGADQALVIADDLPDPGPGMAYELWLIDGAGPQPLGLLDPASSGSVRRALTLDGTPVQWGVTIEPASGSPAPTGDILYSAAA